MRYLITDQELENVIDLGTIKNLLSRIAEIANEKAEHVRENWQDEGLARTWERDAKLIERCAAKVGH